MRKVNPSCFSTRRVAILMWYHYVLEHQSIVNFLVIAFGLCVLLIFMCGMLFSFLTISGPMICCSVLFSKVQRETHLTGELCILIFKFTLENDCVFKSPVSPVIPVVRIRATGGPVVISGVAQKKSQGQRPLQH